MKSDNQKPGRRLALFLLLLGVAGCAFWSVARNDQTEEVRQGAYTMTEDEWKSKLTPEQYRVLRKGGTERAFQNAYWDEHGDGVYHCAGCGQPLYDSETKFESGTGWPSFYEPIDRDKVKEHVDRKFFMTRTEIRCSNCEGHLGHVFTDGPKPTGLRYCMNSAALDFRPKEK